MPWVLVQVPGRSHLHDLAEIHDRHAIAHIFDDSEVVSDEKVREAEVPLEIAEKIYHLGLDGYVERRDRLKAPRLLMADGNAAIWGAVRRVWPEAGEQRCWNHKMRNVLDRLPQREQSEAKDLLRAVVYAPSRAEALKAREVFARRYRPWYPKAVDVLEDDWERMVAFYDFPEDHSKHLRTTNVVESPFAALRLRTTAAKRFKRVESATALIWKLLLVADKRFRRLDAPHLLKDVFEGRKFEDGKPVSTQQRKNAA